MTDTTAACLVTGLTAPECFARFRDMFGECANSYVTGSYDDAKRLRANEWFHAYRTLTCEI